MRNKRLLKALVLAVVLAVLGVAVTLCVIYRNGNDSAPPAEQSEVHTKPPSLKLLSIAERGEWMVVETSYGFFRYPTAFADILAPEVIDQGTSSQLQFIAQIADRSLVLYSMHYNEERGARCGTLRLSDTVADMPVYVEFAEPPQGVSDDWLNTFYAVQETFNDVLDSMAEDSRFTREE